MVCEIKKNLLKIKETNEMVQVPSLEMAWKKTKLQK